MTQTSFGESFFTEDHLVRDGAQIRAILQDMAAERAVLSVQVAPLGGAGFNSSIVEVNPAGKFFLMDELVPAAGNQQLRASKRLRILGRAKGIATAFEAQVEALVRDRYGEVYKIPFPGKLYQLQRREHFRVPPSAHEPVPVRLLPVSGRLLAGELFDISLGGLGLLLKGEAAGVLTRGDNLRCQFTLPEEPPIEVEVEICSLLNVRTRNDASLLRIGCRFLKPAPPARAAIQRYVIQRDREILRQSRLDKL
ncbi:MAG: flagellar brake protein [Pseudomonadota bacterium]